MKIILTEKQALNILYVLENLKFTLSDIQTTVRLEENINHEENYLKETKKGINDIKKAFKKHQ